MRSLLRSISSNCFEAWAKKKYPVLRATFAVSSHLTPQERYRLFKLAADRETILEIGSYVGASACCFGAACKLRGTGKIFCIDTWNNDAMSEGNKNTYQEFLKNTSPFSGYTVPVRGFSTEVVANVESSVRRVDLLFIDGDHSYSGVKADWEAYKKLLGHGSTVVFHDYGWAEGVRQVVQEDVLPVVDSCSQLPNMWWGKISQRI